MIEQETNNLSAAADSRRSRSTSSLLAMTLLCLSLVAALLVQPSRPAGAQAAPGIIFSEILASNQGSVTGIFDADGDSPDFIELANTSNVAVSLAGHLLVDGDSVWAFPDGATIDPGGYLLIWASGKDRVVPELHTNFKLAIEGEYLAVIGPDNEIVVETAPAYPPQTLNVSWGALIGGLFGYMPNPTPGAANQSGAPNNAAMPQASMGRGFYSAAITETLTSSPGATIRYTLDGTPVTATSTLYSGPITITPSATGLVTLRSKAFGASGFESPEASWSYVFADSLYTGFAAQGLTSLPAMILNTDDGSYPDETEKIRSAIEFVDNQAQGEGFFVTAGVKEFGETSVDFEKSSFRMFFDSEFGATELDYPIFEGYGQGFIEPATEFDKLELRGGSWDSWQAAAGGRFNPSDYYLTDRYMRDIRLDMGGIHTHGRFVNVWVNGDYRGFYQLRERFDHQFYSSYTGESADRIEAIKQNDGRYSNNGDLNINGDGSVFDGLTGDYQIDKEWIDSEALVDYALTMSLGEHDFEQEHRGVGSMDQSSDNDYIFIYNDNDMRLRPVSSVLTGPIGFSPGYFVPRLVPFFDDYKDDPEFAQIARQRAERHLCGTGALTVPAMLERLAYWRSEIDLAMRAEHERWEGQRSINYYGSNYVADKYGSWNTNMDSIATRIPSLMPDLTTAWQQQGVFAGCGNLMPRLTVDDQIDAVGVAVSFQVPATDPDGDPLTYTATGLPFGLSMSPSGLVTGAALGASTSAVTISVQDPAGAVSTRSIDWHIVDPQAQAGSVVINEIMYHPADEVVPAGFDPDLASYLEVHNPTANMVDLSGVTVSDGVTFSFPAGTTLEPGEFKLIAESSIGFERTYGFAPDFEYDGFLSNAGERLELRDPNGIVLDEVTFDDQAPWYEGADGLAGSLELTSAMSDNSDAAAWEVSGWLNGSPGRPNKSTGADADCNGVLQIVDALVIAQYAVGNRTDAGGCPGGSNLGSVFAAGGDIDDNGTANIVDALLIAQCVVGVSNIGCP